MRTHVLQFVRPLFSIAGARRFVLLSPLFGLVVFFGTPARVEGQTTGERGQSRGGEGETHLILTYTCSPASRAAFREFMATKGVNQFEQWKKDGAFKSYLVLFSSFVNDGLWDMVVTLDFEKFVDVEKWQEIEKRQPGGLSKEGLALGTPRACVYADLGWRGGKSEHDISKSVFMLIPYMILVETSKYDKYVDAYVIPQMKGWLKAGALKSYRIFQDQNPTNSPWHSLLFFEYDGMRGIALRDTVKNQVRDELKNDPGYEEFSPIKTTIRKELQPVTFVPLLPVR